MCDEGYTIQFFHPTGPDSCTISGPEADIAQFVAELKSQGIFAKEVIKEQASKKEHRLKSVDF